MRIARRFTTAGKDVYGSLEWTTRASRISNADGSTVFEMNDAEVPASWSQLATDIVVSKYFRKAGVPQLDSKGAPRVDASGRPVTGPERSVRQVVHRLAGCWRHWGEKHNYFDTADDAQAFYDELVYMLDGELTLVTDAGRQPLRPGMVVGFPKGRTDGHHLINESDAPARFLVVGSRCEGDECHYSDVDLLVTADGVFRHRSGEPW